MSASIAISGNAAHLVPLRQIACLTVSIITTLLAGMPNFQFWSYMTILKRISDAEHQPEGCQERISSVVDEAIK